MSNELPQIGLAALISFSVAISMWGLAQFVSFRMGVRSPLFVHMRETIDEQVKTITQLRGDLNTVGEKYHSLEVDFDALKSEYMDVLAQATDNAERWKRCKEELADARWDRNRREKDENKGS